VFYGFLPEGSIRINQSKLCEPCPVLLAHCRRGVDDQIELSLGGPKSLGGSLKNLSPIHQSSSSPAEGTCFLFDILREPSGLVKPWLLGLHWGVRFSEAFLIGTWSAFPVYDVHWLRVNACKCIYSWLPQIGARVSWMFHGCFQIPGVPMVHTPTKRRQVTTSSDWDLGWTVAAQLTEMRNESLEISWLTGYRDLC